NIPFDLTTIVHGINSFLAALQDGLTSQILSKLPIVGSSLDLAGTFIGKIRTQFVVPFQNFLDHLDPSFSGAEHAIQQFIFKALGPPGLNILGSRTGNGTAKPSDVIVTLDDQHFEIQITLSGEDSMSADLSSGLAGLPLNAQGQGGVTVGLGYKVDFGIGI